MSVFVSDFNTWSVVHDDAPGGSHGGTVDPASIIHGQNPDGSDNHSFLLVTCPVCDSVSAHPVGGGAQPPLVQELFVVHTEDTGCPCGAIAAGDSSAAPASHVRLNCNRQDGPGRWLLDTPAQIQGFEQSPNMFQVVYRETDRLIVGLEPSHGGVGPDNKVAVIHDMAEYDVLMETDPAYLSADGDHIVSSSPV